MSHPHLPHTLMIGMPDILPMASIPVRDLADASHAYQDYRMRNAPTTCPPGEVVIGFQTFEVAQDGSVWVNNVKVLEPQ